MRPDSARTAAGLRRAFDAYISLSGTPVRSNFSIRSPTGLFGRTPGELLIAGTVVARSRVFDNLLLALCGHLAALACSPRPVEEPRVRAISDGRSVALIDLPRPGLVDDRALAKQGIRELHLWSPGFVEGPAIAVPPPLERVTGLRQAKVPLTMRIAGVVLSVAPSDLNTGYGWLHALGRMGTLPPPTTAADEATTRDAIVALLGEAR